MNSLTTHYRRSQLIALPVPGGKAKVEYCYAVNEGTMSALPW